jgi:Icc-related predicted phosphoesterase
VKFVCISDTHLAHLEQDIEVPAGDVLIHAGDCTKLGTSHEIAMFSEWFAAFPHAHKVMIAGNHDFLFEREPEKAVNSLHPDIHYLKDSEVVIEGLRIWGSPWQPWFHRWAFNLRRGDEIKEKWDLIPEGADIVITHGPPAGVLDLTVSGENAGCADLLLALEDRVRPKLHVFGHIHEGSGMLERSGITYVNASVLDQKYRVKNSGKVVEI